MASLLQRITLCALLSAALPAAGAEAPPGSAAKAEEADDGDAPSDAKEAFDRAARLTQEGRYPEALKALERAAALDPTPAVLMNLGRLREETGDLSGAVSAYRALLLRTRDDGQRHALRARLRALEARQKVQVASAPPPEPPKCPPPPPPVVRVVQAPPPDPPKVVPETPVYRKPWFWAVTVGGALVLAGAAAGATYAATASGGSEAPQSELGTMRFFLVR